VRRELTPPRHRLAARHLGAAHVPPGRRLHARDGRRRRQQVPEHGDRLWPTVPQHARPRAPHQGRHRAEQAGPRDLLRQGPARDQGLHRLPLCRPVELLAVDYVDHCERRIFWRCSSLDSKRERERAPAGEGADSRRAISHSLSSTSLRTRRCCERSQQTSLR